MAEIINLRRARKARARDRAKEQADANAARSGVGKAERALTRAEKSALDRTLDGARREPEDGA